MRANLAWREGYFTPCRLVVPTLRWLVVAAAAAWHACLLVLFEGVVVGYPRG